MSLWAVASTVCSALLVPPLCLIGPILGLIGLNQTGRGKKRGRPWAITGILLGFAASIGWATFFGLTAMQTRPMVLHGPQDAINQGLDEGAAALIARCIGPDRGETALSEVDAAEFLASIEARFGRIISSRQSEDQTMMGKVDDPPVKGRHRIRYDVRFERGVAPMEAVFVMHHPDRAFPWVIRWGSIEIFDAGGTLRFPAGGTGG